MLAERHNFFKNFLLVRTERLKLAVGVMNDADGAGEAESHCAMRDFESIFRIFHAAAENGIDVHLKDGVLRKDFRVSGRAPSNFSWKLRRAARYQC